MKLFLFVFIAVAVFSDAFAGLQGQRVLVFMKSPEVFKEADFQFKRHGRFSLKGVHLGFGAQNYLTTIDANVEDSLSTIQTLVLRVKTESDLAKIEQNLSVAFVEREVFHPAPRPVNRSSFITASQQVKKNFQFKTPWGIKAVKAIEAWKDSKAGEGARVLVLDSGLDKDHPALAANFEKGQDFTEKGGTPYEFVDTTGHGTHCAGTIAGVFDGATGFTGVAPKAKILAGRVCVEEGCSNIAIVQGLNWGVKERVDVVSMSLGGAMSTPAERMAIQRAIGSGVTIVAASGNDGSSHLLYPAALPRVISVGAIDSSMKRADFSQYGPGLSVVAPGVAVVSSVPRGTGREPYVGLSFGLKEVPVASSHFDGTREPVGSEMNEFVDAGLGRVDDFKNIDVKGKYALISRGDIRFIEKVENSISAGAVGIVIYNNVPGLLFGTLTDDGSVLPVPVFMIEKSIGEQAVAALKNGQKVVATLRLDPTDYASFDGTSMATPHVSGVVALMKAANKKLTPDKIKRILQQTATPLQPNTQNEFGAGIVNAELAVSEAIK